jgi:hypothetical protein
VALSGREWRYSISFVMPAFTLCWGPCVARRWEIVVYCRPCRCGRCGLLGGLLAGDSNVVRVGAQHLCGFGVFCVCVNRESIISSSPVGVCGVGGPAGWPVELPLGVSDCYGWGSCTTVHCMFGLLHSYGCCGGGQWMCCSLFASKHVFCRVRSRLLAMLGGGSCALAGGNVACVLDCCRSDGSSWAAAGGTTRGCGRPHVRCVHVGAGDWWMYVVCQADVWHAAGVHMCSAGAFLGSPFWDLASSC